MEDGNRRTGLVGCAVVNHVDDDDDDGDVFVVVDVVVV